MKRQNIETILWCFCIIVLLSLSVRIMLKAETLSCGQCTVTFKDKIVSEQMLTDKMGYKIQDLFEAWAYEDECLAWWDPVQGFGGRER